MLGGHPIFVARELEKVVSPKNKVTTSKGKSKLQYSFLVHWYFWKCLMFYSY